MTGLLPRMLSLSSFCGAHCMRVRARVFFIYFASIYILLHTQELSFVCNIALFVYDAGLAEINQVQAPPSALLVDPIDMENIS